LAVIAAVVGGAACVMCLAAVVLCPNEFEADE
jgi:hypothetical protein